MISLQKISKHYGGEYLFSDISLMIGDDERVAVVGSNGAGKTTLLKILNGLVEPDSGRIVQSRSNTAGYLPQDGVVHFGRSLYEEAASAFDEIIALHRRAEEITNEINCLSENGNNETTELDDLVAELGKIQHSIEEREGYSIKNRIEQVLSGLGFGASDLNRPTDEFSGGWQMRIALAKLLLREPTILMLDEPTNHLDIESLEWLENYLREYRGSVVLVSHDRRFLDNLVGRTIEVSMGRVTDYKGNYSRYLKEKAERKKIQRASYENQQDRIRATMRFVERFRYKATKARQVQSRLKMIEKLDLVEPDDEEKRISFDFPAPPAPGRVLIKIENLTKAYGENVVFEGLSFRIERGDRIAFLGVNGAGKSTLARIIAGIEPFGPGRLVRGHKVIISYYAQNQAEELDPDKTVLQTIEEAAAGEVRTRLRTLLGCFLFTGDDVFKTVSVLSGGEKSRLALARMLITPANLLVLDEPTNHLDMRSKRVLQEALEHFEGSYVIVSHDRDFLEPLINRVVEFRKGKVSWHLGTVGEYLEKLHREREESARRSMETGAGPKEKTSGAPSVRQGRRRDKERKRAEAETRQRLYRRIAPLKETLSRIEVEIEAAEKRKTEVEKELSSDSTYASNETARALSIEYRDITTDLAYHYEEWTRIQEEIERQEGGESER